jgi:hypothetical protein
MPQEKLDLLEFAMAALANEIRDAVQSPRRRKVELGGLCLPFAPAARRDYHAGSMPTHSSDIIDLARKGAEVRYQELRSEMAALLRHFPYLRQGARKSARVSHVAGDFRFQTRSKALEDLGRCEEGRVVADKEVPGRLAHAEGEEQVTSSGDLTDAAQR